jgi:hypothetical protein
MVKSIFDIAKNTLNKSKMRRLRIMHVKANMLHNVSNIRPGKSEILKRPRNATIMSGIINRRMPKK